MAVDAMYLLAKEYLQACEEAVALSPGGAIIRSFVSAGPPAFDCPEQLTVHAGGPAEGDTAPLSPPLQPGHRTDNVGLVNLISLTATVIRCSPTTKEGGGSFSFPNPTELEAVALNTMSDVWAIWNHIRTRYRANTLFIASAPTDRRRELIFDPAVTVNTQGGAAGWMVPIRVQLDGEAL